MYFHSVVILQTGNSEIYTGTGTATTEIPLLHFPSDSPYHHNVNHHVWAIALLQRVRHCLETFKVYISAVKEGK